MEVYGGYEYLFYIYIVSSFVLLRFVVIIDFINLYVWSISVYLPFVFIYISIQYTTLV